MKILYFNALYLPEKAGGAEITMNTIASGLVERGHEVYACVLHSGRDIKREVVNGVNVIRLPLNNIYWPFTSEVQPAWKKIVWHGIDSFNATVVSRIKRVIEDINPDVVSLHNLQGWSSAVWSTLSKMGVPSIQVLHDYYGICPKVTMFKEGRNCVGQCGSCKIYRLPHNQLSNSVTGVIGISEFALNAHLDQGLFQNVPLKKVIHNARRLPDPPVQSEGQGTLSVGFIGGLTPVKGIESLIASFKRVSDRADISLQLLVAGTGKADYEAQLRALSEGYPVTFLGQVNPAEFYPKVDIVVIPSVWNEPLGGVVIEALHYGAATIAAARGGIPEMIDDGLNGLLYDPDKPNAMSEALERLVLDHELRDSFRRRSASSIESFLDIGRMVSQYETVLEEAANYA